MDVSKQLDSMLSPSNREMDLGSRGVSKDKSAKPSGVDSFEQQLNRMNPESRQSSHKSESKSSPSSRKSEETSVKDDLASKDVRKPKAESSKEEKGSEVLDAENVSSEEAAEAKAQVEADSLPSDVQASIKKLRQKIEDLLRSEGVSADQLKELKLKAAGHDSKSKFELPHDLLQKIQQKLSLEEQQLLAKMTKVENAKGLDEFAKQIKAALSQKSNIQRELTKPNQKVAQNSKADGAVALKEAEGLKSLLQKEMSSGDFSQNFGKEHGAKSLPIEESVPKPNVNDLASGLFVQRSLQKEEGLVNQMQMLKNDSFVAAQDKAPEPKMVRMNLFEDMQTFVSRSLKTQEGGEMKLKLRPGHLGDVRVEVKVESNIVKIKMTADSASTETLLKKQSGELKQQLQSAGLKVDDVQISSQKSSGSESQQKQGNPEQRQDGQASRDQEQREEQGRDSEKPKSFEEEFIEVA